MLRQILITPSKREGGLSGCSWLPGPSVAYCLFVFVFYIHMHSMRKACAWRAASGLWFSRVHIDRNLTNTGQDVSNHKQETYLYHFFLSYEQLNNADIKIQGMLTFVCFSYMGLVSLSNSHRFYSLFALPLEFLYTTFSFENENSSLWEGMYRSRFF